MSSTSPFANVPPPPSFLPSALHSPSSTLVSSSHPHRSLFFPSHWSHLPSLTSGAGPFITRLVHRLPSGHRVFWESRRHRKRIPQHVEPPSPSGSPHSPAHPTAPLPRPPWYQRAFPFHPLRVAYWTAVLFDIGSLCFVFSSICEFIPGVYDSEHLNTAMVGWTAFVGSVFFTAGSVLGVLEVMKAPLMASVYPMAYEAKKRLEASAQSAAKEPKASSDPSNPSTFVELLRRLDFWVTAIQLIGAIAFNINTFAFSGSFVLTTAQTTGLVDFCDVFASCCFTVSGYLSIMEVTHSFLPLTAHPLHDLTRLDMHITWNNLLGGLGFLANGVLIIYYPDPGQLPPAYPLLLGSVFFQIGSHLQYLEQGDKWPSEGNKAGVSDNNAVGKGTAAQDGANGVHTPPPNGDSGGAEAEGHV